MTQNNRPQNPLSGIDLDRMAERREDAQWLRDRLHDPSTRVIAMHDGQGLVTQSNGHAKLVMLAPSAVAGAHYVAFLGIADERAYFSVSLDQPYVATLTTPPTRDFQGLRSVAPHLPEREASLLCYARGLDLWQRAHRYCGRCGSVTTAASAGFRLVCANSACRREHFPRLDPAIIVIVEHAGKCLLGRQRNWDAGRYSTLAGFVEPGESLEEAVVREVAEEAGVTLASVSYHSSQPWPFPASIMIGFNALASSATMRIGDELEDARWFTVDELEHAVRAGTVLLPWPASVSHRLITDWISERHGRNVRDWTPPT